MKERLIKHKRIITLIVVFLIIFGLSFVRRPGRNIQPQDENPNRTPPPVVVGDWGNLSDIVNGLGEPVSGSTQYGAAQYKSDSETRNDKVYFDVGVAQFYKEIVTTKEGKKGESLRRKFGKEEIQLFGPLSDTGYFLYAYPTKGIAYVANETTDTIFEIWYFAPTDNETFMSTWAKEEGYSLTPPQQSF